MFFTPLELSIYLTSDPERRCIWPRCWTCHSDTRTCLGQTSAWANSRWRSADTRTDTETGDAPDLFSDNSEMDVS